MKIEDIKFSRVRDSEYETVRHYFYTGTKHLPAVYTTKHYSYVVYDAETHEPISHGSEYLPTLKDVKKWISEYDEEEDKRLAEIAEEEKENQEYLAEEEATEKAFTSFLEPTQDVKPAVGDMLTLREPYLNKNSHIAEYLVQLLPDYKNYQKVIAKISKVVELTDEQWDSFVVDLFDPQELFELDVENGTGNDDEQFKDKTFETMTSDDWSNFHINSYEIYYAITAPNRKTFYVNPHGHKYIRYVAFV